MDIFEDEADFDPRTSARKPWLEGAAALAAVAALAIGGFAIASDHGGAKRDEARAERNFYQASVEAPAQTYVFAQAGADIGIDVPLALAAPEGDTLSGPIDYYEAIVNQQMPDRPSGLSVEQLTVNSGDTLGRILTRAGVSTQQAAEAISALKAVWDPRYLRAGQDITLYLHTSAIRKVATTPDAPDLMGLSLKTDVDRTVAVGQKSDGAYEARELVLELTRQLVRASGSVDATLYNAALDAGATDMVIVNFAQLFSFSVDIQREIQTGDDFEILYEEFRGPDGELVKTGDIYYAALETKGDLKQLYRFEAAEGVDWFDAAGVSIRRFLMKTPINGARLSSSFGPRHHPIQGYTKMHKGTDFAAPRGTPIYAAGDGTIAKQYRSSSYGNYIRIKHNDTWQTAYAHMHNFASGMREGKRVRQGDVIGYVGTTGASTGNHLHYEVLKDGVQVNSMSVKVPTGKELEGDELARFAAARNGIVGQYAEAPTAMDARRVSVAAVE